ncbi:phosphotransferase family protein [Nocardioides sp. LML1-1-1.1]|uniref:phosphotransferase family protein n=1 Tax=Nocardioides sp. LML1-1-1.1 TaxID=3135248 RepID=UPI0034215BEC
MSGSEVASREATDRPPPAGVDVVAGQLLAWAHDVYGTAADVLDVHPMPGHSGYSFGFTLCHDAADERLVIRMPPPGTKQRRNTDVLRQSRVMKAMAASGVPVPEIRHEGDGERWFGSPYFMASHVHGRSTSLFRAGIAEHETGEGLAPVFRSAMESLAAIHSVDWQRLLDGWAQPTTLEQEIAAWQPTLHKSTNQTWIDEGVALAGRLHDTRPPEGAYSVVHGDYYSNNWLFDDGAVTAVVDWEIAGIAAPALDVAWVAMFYDDECWGPRLHRWPSWWPDPDVLVTQYSAAIGAEPANYNWMRALANYRFGCIIARAYELHLTGKINEPAWEINAEALPRMFAQARRLLSRG